MPSDAGTGVGSKRRSKDMEWELSTFLPAESKYHNSLPLYLNVRHVEVFPVTVVLLGFLLPMSVSVQFASRHNSLSTGRVWIGYTGTRTLHPD
ncbi:hypothetical protein BaRGS_00024194 [Batillaria attramentaria]|uniref:Transmembrane protein n=1 Tax=Batillaria attramentaria TaxID=370345 RepID=A0ABD0KBZ1_9CAEN